MKCDCFSLDFMFHSFKLVLKCSFRQINYDTPISPLISSSYRHERPDSKDLNTGHSYEEKALKTANHNQKLNLMHRPVLLLSRSKKKKKEPAPFLFKDSKDCLQLILTSWFFVRRKKKYCENVTR